MSEKAAREQRRNANAKEQQRARADVDWDARYRRVLAAYPLPPEDKARLQADAAYMVARLRGEAARPPAHWSPEQIAAFAQILADPEARDAALAWALEGWRQLHADAAALPDDDPASS